MSRTDRRLLRIPILVALVLFALPMFTLRGHVSSDPQILGRFSPTYSVFLAGYLLALAVAIASTYRMMRADDHRMDKLAARLAWLRTQKPLYLLALVSPWLVLFASFGALENNEVGRSRLVQASAIGLVLIFNFVVATAGRPTKELPESLAKIGLLVVSAAITLAAIEIALRSYPAIIPDASRSHLAGGGMFLRQDLVFDDGPIRTGFHYQPYIDLWIEIRESGARTVRDPRDGREDLQSDQEPVIANIHFITDENGYVNEPPLSNRYDIVATGDSFSVEAWVSEPWPKLLGQLADQSVINLAIPMYSPQSEVEAVKLYGLDKQPKWLIVGYFEGNDLSEAGNYAVKKRSGLGWIEYDLRYAPLFGSSAAVQSLRYGLADLIERAFMEVLSLFRAADGGSDRYPITAYLGSENVELVLHEPYISILTASRSDIETSVNYGEATKALLDLKQDSDNIGARLLIVYIPSKEHVYAPLLQNSQPFENILSTLPHVRLAADGYLSFQEEGGVTTEIVIEHMDDQRNAIAAFAMARGILFLDLTPHFQSRAAEGENLYNYGDTHWNQAGHELAAQLIANKIKGE